MSDSVDKALTALGSGDSLPPMSDKLRAELENLEPVKTANPLRRFAIAGLISALWLGGLLALLGLRRDLEFLPGLWLVVYVASWFATFLALSFFAHVPKRGSVMPRSAVAGRLGLAAGLGFLAVGLIAARQVPGVSTTYDPTLGNILGYSYYCIAVGMMASALPIAIAAVLLRRSAPVGSAWLGMAVGAGGGALGGMLLHLHCPIAEPTHLGPVHGGVVLLAAAVGALVLTRVSAIRSP